MILPRDPLALLFHVVFMIPALLLGLILHEAAHAAAATAQGDLTPRNQGRLSLDPRRHLDPLGTIMVFVFGFGYARPVAVNPSRMRGEFSRVLVALAGPAANLALAVLASFPMKLLEVDTVIGARFVAPCSLSASPQLILQSALFYIYTLNLFLFVFNLLPLPALDGFELVRIALRRRNPQLLYRIEMQSQAIMLVAILAFLFLPGLLDGILRFVIVPIAGLLGPPLFYPCV